MADIRQIKSPDYASSRERMNNLRNLVIDGREADYVIKYADKFVDECRQSLLEYAEKGQEKLMNEAALEYRVALKFMNMLKRSAELGRQKEETLDRLKHL